jgi:hypothetical protein
MRSTKSRARRSRTALQPSTDKSLSARRRSMWRGAHGPGVGRGQVDATSALRRSSDLLGRNFISQATHDAVVARYDKAHAGVVGGRAAIAAAEANARAAQVALDQTLIRAPFDGVILTKNANVGDNNHAVFVGGGSQGGRGHDGRHGHARSRSGRVGIEPVQDRGRAAGRDPARRLPHAAAGRQGRAYIRWPRPSPRPRRRSTCRSYRCPMPSWRRSGWCRSSSS